MKQVLHLFPNQRPFIENDPVYRDFLGQVCLEWERAVEPASFMGKRLVKFRTGIVLCNEGGMLDELKKPLKFGFATILGNGKQIISWIHIDDLVRLFMYAIETDSMEGVYNAVAPGPVSNKVLVLEIARKEKGKSYIPVHVPTFVLKIRLGEMSVEVLKSATVSNKKIEKAGYQFMFPSIEAAVKNLK